ncbi:MAG: copper chaperone PCu(A)C [Burkholderiales bacterium]|nr:copper chaperone PCu(A)C [Burkholderiales bacterium]
MKFIMGSVLLLLSGMVFAAEPVSVTRAWVAESAPGQEEGAAYMDISSSEDAKLVEASSPDAQEVMIHSMTMKNGVMEMRMLNALSIPAGATVSLAPGKLHLMLVDIRKRLVQGEHVSLKLTFTHGGRKSVLDVDAPVMSMGHRME